MKPSLTPLPSSRAPTLKNRHAQEKDEHLFELTGSHWERLLQVRELAAFLGCGLQFAEGIPTSKEDQRKTR